jgi:hypothetical protein
MVWLTVTTVGQRPYTHGHLHVDAEGQLATSHEVIDIVGNLANAKVQVDTKYLLDGLGRPARCWYLPDNPASPLIVDIDEGPSSRLAYILAPCR